MSVPSSSPKSTASAGSAGKTVIGKLHGSPGRNLVGNKMRIGEFGSKPTYYGLTIGLIDQRNPPFNCYQYYHDKFRTSGHLSYFKEDFDRLAPMVGKEIILENVRKSKTGSVCVFSSYRLNTNTAATAGKGIGDIGKGMAPAGNRLVEKVSVMGVRLCGDIVVAGDYLEGLGYKYASTHARKLGYIDATREEGIDHSVFKIQAGGSKTRKTIASIMFGGTFKDGPNLFEREKARFERETGIKLKCKDYRGSSGQVTECNYFEGDPNRIKPYFSYSITTGKTQKSFGIDATTWDYPGCGR